MYADSHEHLPKTLWAFIWFFIKKQYKAFSFTQIFSFAWSLDHTLWPVVIMIFIDDITNYVGDRSDMWSYLSLPIILGLSLWLSVEISFRLSGIISANLFPKFEANVRMSMFSYVQHHSYKYFSNNMAGSIANKISDMPKGLTRILQMIIQLFIPVILAFIISLALFTHLQPLFGLLLLGWLTIHMGISVYFCRQCSNTSKIHSESRSTLAGKIVDALTNNMNVRLFSNYKFEKHYLARYQKDEQEKHWNSLWALEKMKLAMGIATFICIGIGMNALMLIQWQKGHLTTGEVVFIFNTSWNITMMAWLAGMELPQLFMEIGVCRQALTIIQDPHDIQDSPNASELEIKKGGIVFDNITFRYHSNTKLFRDKTIEIYPGEKVGLVGFSGSGKTTFVNLILRYYDLEKGRILIDGQDIAKMTQESLRRQIAIIPQDPTLFHRSLMENIRYGRLDATDEEVYEASRKAHCNDFIDFMPEKYNTLVGERGAKLSGGQRQRIAIARAILKNAPILILDEATSALDSVTERKIQDALVHLMQGRTTIVIAHRLSTLSDMDRILVFSEGKIIEDGTQDELLNLGGYFTKMWNMQAGGFLTEDYDEEPEITEDFEEEEEEEVET